MDVKKVAVIGGGTMGNGIAHVFAMNGFSVNLIETKQEFADRAMSTIEKNLDRMVKKEKIDEGKKDSTMDSISVFLDVAEGVKDVDMVVEAVPENLDIKTSVWKQVDEAAPDHAIFGSNTSSISITKLAALTSRPEKFIGMHFFNPVPVMIFCVGEGVATAENVDEVMKLGMAHPMGPLRLADFIGLDVCLDILDVLYEGFKDPKYRPAPLLVKMVDAGKLGNKTGEGFYKYD